MKASEHPEEVRDHVQEAIMEVAEFMVPQKSQRFRKRDRFAFHGKKLMRKVASNMERVKSDPLVIPKRFLKYAAGEADGSTATEDFYLQGASILYYPSVEVMTEILVPKLSEICLKSVGKLSVAQNCQNSA